MNYRQKFFVWSKGYLIIIVFEHRHLVIVIIIYWEYKLECIQTCLCYLNSIISLYMIIVTQHY